MATTAKKRASKPVASGRKIVNKTPSRSIKSSAAAATIHPHLQTAQLMEGRSAPMLEDMHQVLQKHGFQNLTIRSMAFSASAANASPPAGLCPVWRCHTDPNGDNVCGWVLEPC